MGCFSIVWGVMLPKVGYKPWGTKSTDSENNNIILCCSHLINSNPWRMIVIRPYSDFFLHTAKLVPHLSAKLCTCPRCVCVWVCVGVCVSAIACRTQTYQRGDVIFTWNHNQSKPDWESNLHFGHRKCSTMVNCRRGVASFDLLDNFISCPAILIMALFTSLCRQPDQTDRPLHVVFARPSKLYVATFLFF